MIFFAFQIRVNLLLSVFIRVLFLRLPTGPVSAFLIKLRGGTKESFTHFAGGCPTELGLFCESGFDDRSYL